jgi:hypothetical protein
MTSSVALLAQTAQSFHRALAILLAELMFHIAMIQAVVAIMLLVVLAIAAIMPQAAVAAIATITAAVAAIAAVAAMLLCLRVHRLLFPMCFALWAQIA